MTQKTAQAPTKAKDGGGAEKSANEPPAKALEPPSSGKSRFEQQRAQNAPGANKARGLYMAMDRSMQRQDKMAQKVATQAPVVQAGIDKVSPSGARKGWQTAKKTFKKAEKQQKGFAAMHRRASAMTKEDLGDAFDEHTRGLTKLKVDETTQGLKLDTAAFQVSFALTGQEFRGKPLKGSYTVGMMGKGDTLKTMDAMGDKVVALLFDAKVLVQKLAKYDASINQLSTLIDANTALGEIDEIIERNGGRDALILMHLVETSDTPGWFKNLIGKQRVDALLEADAENKLIPPARMRLIEETVAQIKDELDDFVFAEDNKLTKLVAKYEGLEREYLMHKLTQEGLYNKLFYRGDSEALDALREDAGVFAGEAGADTEIHDRQTGETRGMREFQEAHKPFETAAGLDRAADEVDKLAMYNFIPGVCRIMGGVFRSMAELPVIGGLYAKAASNMNDLATEVDIALGNDKRFDPKTLKFRNAIGDASGELLGDLMLSGMEELLTSAESGQNWQELLEDLKSTHTALEPMMTALGAGLNIGTLAFDVNADSKEKRQALAKELGTVTDSIIGAIVQGYCKTLPNSRMDRVVGQAMQAEERREYLDRAHKDEAFGEAHRRFAQTTREAELAVQSGDAARSRAAASRLEKDKLALSKEAQRIRKEAAEELKALKEQVAELRAAIQSMEDIRGQAAVVLGFLVKQGVKWLIRQVLGADHPRINPGAIIKAIPDAAFDTLKDIFIAAMGKLAESVKGGGKAGAFGKFGAKLAIATADFAYGDEIAAWAKENVQDVYDQWGDIVNGWIDKNLQPIPGVSTKDSKDGVQAAADTAMTESITKGGAGGVLKPLADKTK